MMMPRSLIALLSCGAFLAAACGVGGTDGGTADTTIAVEATDFAFDPANISVDAGETVELTFTNAGVVEHSFTIRDVVDIEAEGDEEATMSFTAPDATIAFYCKFHPDQMQGELAVGGSSQMGGGEKDKGSGRTGAPGYDY
ncbi:MAG: cupredoxin domain-containing protein [Actinomycetota bacterium]